MSNPNEDHLSQLLGPENPGRLRTMGRGMNMTNCVLQGQEQVYDSNARKVS